jgi:hypothetical protein
MLSGVKIEAELYAKVRSLLLVGMLLVGLGGRLLTGLLRAGLACWCCFFAWMPTALVPSPPDTVVRRLPPWRLRREAAQAAAALGLGQPGTQHVQTDNGSDGQYNIHSACSVLPPRRKQPRPQTNCY